MSSADRGRFQRVCFLISNLSCWILLSGCADSTRSYPSPESPELGVEISAEPIALIGGTDGRGAHGLSRVVDVAISPDGSLLAISEGEFSEVRVFSVFGDHIVTIGREGQGPGEFLQGPTIRFLSPDTIVAWDPRQRRVSWFSVGSGTLISEQTIRSPVGRDYRPGRGDFLADGSLITTDRPTFGSVVSVDAHTRLVTPIAPFVSAAPSDPPTVVGGLVVRSPFVPSTRFAASLDDVILVSDSERWVVTGYDRSGQELFTVRVPRRRTPVTPELIDDAHEAIVHQMGLTTGPDLRSTIQRLPHPDSVPAISAIFWEAPEQIWLGATPPLAQGPIKEFELVTPQGAWVSSVVIPSSLGVVRDVGPGLIATVRTDLETGLPTVAVHEFTRTQPKTSSQ